MKHVLTLLLIACSCIVSAQSEYCLDGTVWDAALGGCVPVSDCLLDSDLDGNGTVGSSDLLSFLSEFGGSFPDADADGICDDNEDCVGEVDECGVCNGPGPTIEVILDITILYDSVYADQIDDWFVFEVGADTTFTYICEPIEPVFVSCGDLVSYQGYNYETVLIGDQCWFAENLRSEHYSNGDAILANIPDSVWVASFLTPLTSGGTAVYGEGSSNCNNYSPDGDACDEAWSLNEYGRLYNWFAVNDFRGLCPSGWHVSTDEEWTTLTDFLGGASVAGDHLKATYGWGNTDGYFGNGSNSSGFSGLPGGWRDSGYGWFRNAVAEGKWWTASSDGYYAWHRNLFWQFGSVSRYSAAREIGMSVRCIKDTE